MRQDPPIDLVDLPGDANPFYSAAAAVNTSPVFVAGQIGRPGSSLGAQAYDAMRRVGAILKHADADAASLRIYVLSSALKREGAREELLSGLGRGSYLEGFNRPPTTLLVVEELFVPGTAIEIEAVGAVHN